jgi:hypothetical protein
LRITGQWYNQNHGKTEKEQLTRGRRPGEISGKYKSVSENFFLMRRMKNRKKFLAKA